MTMRTASELREAQPLHAIGPNALGEQCWIEVPGVIGGARVQLFDRAGAEAREAYVSLHEHAHLWIHRDYDHDAWHVIDVDEPREVGRDFVIMPRRIGDSIASWEASDDPGQPPERLGELRALVPKLVAAAATPRDRFVAELIASRVARADANTIYVWAERRFYIQDLTPSPGELAAWRALPDDPS